MYFSTQCISATIGVLLAVLISGCDSSISYRDACDSTTLPDGVKFYEENRAILSKFPEKENNFRQANVLVIIETADEELFLPAINIKSADKSGFMGGVRKAYICKYKDQFLSAEKVREIDVPVSDTLSTIYFHICKLKNGQKPSPDIDDWFVWQLPTEFEEPLIFPTQHTGEVTEKMKEVREFAIKHKDKW